jgi:hypothetical protein
MNKPEEFNRILMNFWSPFAELRADSAGVASRNTRIDAASVLLVPTGNFPFSFEGSFISRKKNTILSC